MRLIKPQSLSLLHQPMEIGDRYFLAVGVLALFHFEQPGVLQHEAKLWQVVAEELGPDAVVDEGQAKPHGEVLVDGRAYPPSPPQPACDVRVVIGPIDKTLRVVGDRRWRATGATEPTPFMEMPLGWSRAFGGDGHADNPVGRGAGRAEGRHWLPNILRPTDIIRAPSDQVTPAGFGAIPIEWRPRARHAGNYDARWLRERAPSPPEDRDLRLFQQAPSDQWLPEPLRGDEAFVIHNMHPERARLEGRLPGVRVRCLVSFNAEGTDVREQPMRLETVRLFPHREVGIAIFRGLVETVEDDADDVAVVLVAAETLDEVRPREAYEAALRRRLDPDQATAWLDERDLLPCATHESTEARPPWNDPTPDGALEKRVRARAALALEAARETMLAEGIDPDAHGLPRELPPAAPPVDPARMQDEIDEAKRQAEEARTRAEKEARAACAEAGIDYDAMMTKARKDAARPPAFSAAKIYEELQEQLLLAQNAGVMLPAVTLLRDPENFRTQLAKQEAMVREAYRRFAHEGPEPVIEAEESAAMREALRAALERGESLEGRDFTGVDCRGLPLAGADLRGAFLAAANLEGSDLSGARLEGTVLAFARAAGARLSGAPLDGTNLGKANLGNGALDGVGGRETVLSGADLSRAQLDSCRLEAPELDGACLVDVHGEGVRLHEVFRARGVSARGARLGVELEVGMVIDLDASEADLSKASLTRVGLADSVWERAKFRGARLERCAFAGSARMEGCDLSEATVMSTTLAGAQLPRASFREATLDGVDLSRANLEGASLYRARARRALFARANLEGANAVSLDAREAVMDRARLRGTDLTGAHLFGATLARVDVDEQTKFDDAITERAHLSHRKKVGG